MRFAEIIREQLQGTGHDVTLTSLKAEPPVKAPVKQPWPFRLVDVGDHGECEAILVGGPVWAFGASPVVMASLELLPLQGKLFVPFVTMALPFVGLGGKQAIRSMTTLAAAKGAHTLPGHAAPLLFRRQGAIMEKSAQDLAQNVLAAQEKQSNGSM